MRMFEYQAKSLFKLEGLSVPKSTVLYKKSDIPKAIDEIGLPLFLKVQTLIGGRGKAGGIQVVYTKDEVEQFYERMIGTFINGKKVESILAEKMVQFDTEYYLSFIFDSPNREIKMLFSTSGGVDIEENISNLFVHEIQNKHHFDKFKIIEILSRASIPKECWNQFILTINKLYELFLKYDCTLLEINPFVMTPNKEIKILDVHLYIDDNAIPRQDVAKEIVEKMPTIYPQLWYKIKHGFDLVTLNSKGTVGLLSTGAGLTMAIIDELQSRNIEPINFSDVRSGQLKGDATRLILILKELKDKKNLSCIFVSIFAGITDLAEFAKLLLEAKKQVALPDKVNWVIRLEGNNFEQAKVILESEKLFVTNSLEDALERVNQEVKGVKNR
ncbi:ATP-grasp domain-containing protein [Alkalihalobacillus sp. BA299]|uniref:ATP-grasp domain-containing protein n=1 Tax=Alkalihalobacillus sp. BA299 TaxID=2815938 RepID=UPI001ADA0C6A|nr:ATP-grasp domain-containing protein [Alkalihalobacillus sp. BA299]